MAIGDKLLMAVVMTLSINVIMVFVAYGITDLGGTSEFNGQLGILGSMNVGNSTNPGVSANVSDQLPGGGSTSISVYTGNVFTDMFSSIRTWLVESTGLSYVLGIFTAPAVILSAMGFPPMLAFGLNALWYGLTLLIFISFIWGR